MTLDEAIEWCVIHKASIEFTEMYGIESGTESIVLVTPAYRPGVKHSSTPDVKGIIEAVERAQKEITESWDYQRLFTRYRQGD